MVKLLGIVNVTTDSFHAASRVMDPDAAAGRVRAMLAAGADAVDIGPASSHPDAAPVTATEERRRLAPVLDRLADVLDRVSIDSFQGEVQLWAAERGVGCLNDIHGFPDPDLYPALARAHCRLIVMHAVQSQGPATRTGALTPETALGEIVRFLEARIAALTAVGIARERLIVDPGIGFFLSPAPETSFQVLANLGRLKDALGLPVLVSVSRKSFLGAATGLGPETRGPATLAAELHAAAHGADYIRTHAPAELASALAVTAALAARR